MQKRITVSLLVIMGVVAFLAGAAFSGPSEEGKKPEMPQAPPPPPELKALDAFAGQWRSNFEFLPVMMGEPGSGTGMTKCEWVLDGWFVMSKFKGTSSYGPYEAIGMMTYDPMEKTYKSYHFSNHGESGVATMSHDPAAKTWTLVADAKDMAGKPAKHKTVMRFVSDEKMEWEWSQQSQGATDFTVMMKGTDERMPGGK
jgi:hypothetical protein